MKSSLTHSLISFCSSFTTLFYYMFENASSLPPQKKSLSMLYYTFYEHPIFFILDYSYMPPFKKSYLFLFFVFFVFFIKLIICSSSFFTKKKIQIKIFHVVIFIYSFIDSILRSSISYIIQNVSVFILLPE